MAQLPARDRPADAATGAGSISGVVVIDDARAQPVRRARVTLGGPITRQMAITDDEGRFAFVALPAGRFTLFVVKDAYAPMSFGARRSGGPGTSIVLADTQQVSGLTIRLPRGAVITGTVFDQNGQPTSWISVHALRYTFINSGERRLTPVRSSMTNDRGQYRIYGLAPGEYYVAASAPRGGGVPAASDLRAITPADIVKAKQELTSATATQSTPGMQARTSGASSAESVGRPVNYAQVYYPSTTVQAQAAMISLAKGEERSGIDIQLQLRPTARIEGTVSATAGVAPNAVTVHLVSTGQQAVPGMMFESIRTARPDAQGRFTFASVSPGQYVLTARANEPGAPTRPAASRAPAATLWAMTDLVVDGNDILNVALDLQPGLTVSGRLHFESTELMPPDPSRFRVSIVPPPSPTGVNLGVAAVPVAADGTFTLTGVVPGAYRITSGVPAGLPDGSRWMLKSSMVTGRDSLEAPVDIRSSIDGVVMTFTDRATEMSGVLQDASGNAASDYYIIVFPHDRNLWTPQSRRVQAVRPAHDGNYLIRNLPPGEYLLAAMMDVEHNEWHDRSFLERIAGAAMRFTIAEAERKKQDLRLGGPQ